MPKRYGVSMHDTYRCFLEAKKLDDDKDIKRKITECGDIILKKMPILIKGAKELLEWGKENCKQVLFTRGVKELQNRKINTAGIRNYFYYIEIVNSKGAHELKKLLKRINADIKSTWMIGDSIKADVNPSIEAGLNCILYIYEHHTYYWQQEYGHDAIGPFYCVKELREVRNIIENPGYYEKKTSIT